SSVTCCALLFSRPAPPRPTPFPYTTLFRSASATDDDGVVSKVEFLGNNSLLGETTQSTYSLIWSNVEAGTYILSARATDNLGSRSEEHTSELQSRVDVVCRLLLEKKKSKELQIEKTHPEAIQPTRLQH